MLETAKADPVSPTAFQAARLLRNLSYSEGTPLRWQLHSAGAMEAVETLLSGVRAAASAVAGAAGEAGATPQAGVVLPHNDAHHSIRFQALQALALIYGAWAHDAKPVKGKEEAKGGSSPAAGDETDAARRASEVCNPLALLCLQHSPILSHAHTLICTTQRAQILKKENMVDLLCGMLHAIVNDQGSSKIVRPAAPPLASSPSSPPPPPPFRHRTLTRPLLCPCVFCPQFYGIDWSLGPWSGPLTCRVMATNGAFAVELAEKGAVELLSEVRHTLTPGYRERERDTLLRHKRRRTLIAYVFSSLSFPSAGPHPSGCLEAPGRQAAVRPRGPGRLQGALVHAYDSQSAAPGAHRSGARNRHPAEHCWRWRRMGGDKPPRHGRPTRAARRQLLTVFSAASSPAHVDAQARPAVRAAVEALRAACESERFYSPEWAQTVDGILGQLAAEPPAEGADAEVQRFDVFLSHKRSDSADFTRGLYNFLSLKGFKCFLDFEFRDELNGER